MCLAIKELGPVCITDPSSCKIDEAWLEGKCVPAPKLGDKCDLLTAKCPEDLYCHPDTSRCAQSQTLEQLCTWAPAPYDGRILAQYFTIFFLFVVIEC